MNHRRRPSRHAIRRVGRPLATLGFLLLLAQQLGALDHQTKHSPGPTLTHDEALHPDADAHVEQEEHERLEHCPACIHGSDKAAQPLGTSAAFLSSTSLLLAASGPAAFSHAWVTHPPRAPPA